jgi:hypothetical protein
MRPLLAQGKTLTDAVWVDGGSRMEWYSDGTWRYEHGGLINGPVQTWSRPRTRSRWWRRRWRVDDLG